MSNLEKIYATFEEAKAVADEVKAAGAKIQVRPYLVRDPNSGSGPVQCYVVSSSPQTAIGTYAAISLGVVASCRSPKAKATPKTLKGQLVALLEETGDTRTKEGQQLLSKLRGLIDPTEGAATDHTEESNVVDSSTPNDNSGNEVPPLPPLPPVE